MERCEAKLLGPSTIQVMTTEFFWGLFSVREFDNLNDIEFNGISLYSKECISNLLTDSYESRTILLCRAEGNEAGSARYAKPFGLIGWIQFTIFPSTYFKMNFPPQPEVNPIVQA